MNSLLKILFLFTVVIFNGNNIQAQDAEKKPAEKQEESDADSDSLFDADSDTLPLLEELKLPSLDRLLGNEKQDWIVFITGRALPDVPALYPRPDKLAWMLQQQEKMIASQPTDPGVKPTLGRAKKNARDNKIKWDAAAIKAYEDDLKRWNKVNEQFIAWNNARKAYQKDNLDGGEYRIWIEKYKSFHELAIEFPADGIEEDYSIPVRQIEYILYHEDLALRKADELIKKGNSYDAQRLISTVARWNFRNNLRRKKENLVPGEWPGLLNRKRALLALNIKQATAKGLHERAFALAKIHWGYDPGFNQLPILLGKVFQNIAMQASAENDYRKVRFYLRNLKSMFPVHKQVTAWQAKLTNLSADKLKLAKAAFDSQKFRLASQQAQLAVQIWPYDAQQRRRMQKYQNRYQILRSGSLVNDPLVNFYQHSLYSHQWFHIEKITEGYPRYRSNFIESWAPDNLGRTIRLKMKLTAQASESRPNFESYQLASQLTTATLLKSPADRGISANSIDSIYVHSPGQLEIRLTSQTAHPLGLFAGLLDNQTGPLKNSNFPLQKNMKKVAANAAALETKTYSRATPQPSTASRFGVAEVTSHIFADRTDLLRGLLRDEIDYVPHLPLNLVKELKQDQRFFITKYHTPVVRMLRFHFQGAYANQSAFRQSLLAACDREKMRDHIAEARQIDPAFLPLTNSIAPSTSHAVNLTDRVVKSDRIAAGALFTILTQSRKTKPEIRLLVPKDVQSKLLAELIKLQWEKLGMIVHLVSSEFKDEKQWDVAIVFQHMLAPQHGLVQLLSSQNQLSETELQTLPLPVQRSLLRLEEARSWTEIDNALRELQDYLSIDAWVLPLWEQTCFQVIRKEARSTPKNLMKPYQNLDHWTLDPVIPVY